MLSRETYQIGREVTDTNMATLSKASHYTACDLPTIINGSWLNQVVTVLLAAICNRVDSLPTPPRIQFWNGSHIHKHSTLIQMQQGQKRVSR